MTTQLWSIIVVFIGTIIGAFGALFFKQGADNLKLNLKVLLKNHKLVLGFILYFISAVFYIIALKGGELSIIYPFVSLAYIWIILLSIKVLKEKMNTLRWIGVAAIVVGVVFIGIGM